MRIRCYGARGLIPVSGKEFLAYGGDTTYLDALHPALMAQVRRFGLFHHNQDRTDAEQDGIVQRCREVLEEKDLGLECFALTQSTELHL